MRKFAALVLGIIAFLPVHGIDVTRRYNENDGLSDNCVLDLFQDSRGYIWMLENNSLERFDGNGFRRYSPAGPLCFFNSMTPHGDGRHIWVGSINKPMLFDSETGEFSTLQAKTADGTEVFFAHSFAYDRDGNLWIAAVNGVFRYDEAKNELTRFQENLARVAYVDYSGNIWIGTGPLLKCFDRRSSTFVSVADISRLDTRFAANSITAIAQSSDGRLWFSTWNGEVIWFDKSDGSMKPLLFGSRCKPAVSRVHCIYDYSESDLLLASDSGLFLCDKSNGRTVLFNEGTASDSYYKIIKDSEGGLWISSYFDGVAYISPLQKYIERYSGHPGGSLKGNAVRDFCEDGRGGIWIATENGGLNRMDLRSRRFEDWTRFTHNNIHAVEQDGALLWIGTFSRGLDCLDTASGKVRHWRAEAGNEASLPDDHVFCLCKTSRGELYIGTLHGACVMQAGSGTIERLDPIRRWFVSSIAEDGEGGIWFATKDAGIYRKSADGKWTHWCSSAAGDLHLGTDRFNSLLCSSNGQIWCSNDDGGIYHFSPTGNWAESFGVSEGLPPYRYFGILEDGAGNLWISSNSGIVRFNPQSRNFLHFTQAEGLQSDMLNTGAYRSADGKMWFGGSKGFSVFSPDKLHKNIVAAKVQISSVSYDSGKEHVSIAYPQGTIRIPHNALNLDISYVAPSYVAPKNISYAWRLSGYHKAWIETEDRHISIVKIPSGDYHLAVKAHNNDGLWGPENDVLSLRVSRNPFLSFPAFLLYALIAGSILIAIIRSVRRRREEEKEIAEYRSKLEFFSNIAHEIKTPVTLIKAPLEQVITAGEWSKDVESKLSMIHSNTNRLEELVKQLLDFRKIDTEGYTLKCRQVDLCSLVKEMVNRFTPVDGSASIQASIPDYPVECLCDREAIVKILSNLLMNALKHGGPAIRVSLECEDRKIKLKVSDNGPGVPENLLESVFKPFYQVSPGSDDGFGIGLSLVRLLVEKMQGSVTMKNIRPSGCEVLVSLPLQCKAPEGTVLQKREEDEKDFTDTLLIVDDNADMRRLIKDIFSEEYRTLTASNGIEALDILSSEQVSIIISDLMMPMMDGFELLQALRKDEVLRNIPFIILSAKDTLDAKIAGLEKGADAYIEKPFSISELKATIGNIVSTRKRLMDEFSANPEQKLDTGNIVSQDRVWLNKVDGIIKDHLSDSSFGTDKLAEELAMSRSSLQRKLKGLVGVTPNDYIKIYRLRTAARIISTENYRVGEVAWMVGFNDPSYFTKCFVGQFGVLPKDWQRSRSQQEEPAL